MAAGGYPDQYAKGDVITGLPTVPEADRKVFHAGTVLKENTVVTQGGRVLCVTALGTTVSHAQQSAYALLNNIHWRAAYYRKDIAWRAIAREKAMK